MTTSVQEAPQQIETLSPRQDDAPPPQEPSPPSSDNADSPPARLREIAAVVLSVIAFDAWIYRGHGFSGYAAFFISIAALLLFASPQMPRWKPAAILGGMLLVLAARMVWLGFGFLNAVGIAVIAAFAVAAIGRRPYVLDVAVHAAQSVVAGFPAIANCLRSFDRLRFVVPRATWLKVVLPAAAVLGFGTIFVLANPDVAAAVGARLRDAWNVTWDAVFRFSPEFNEIVCWMFVALCVGGLLRPLVNTWILQPLSRPVDSEAAAPLFEAPLYAAFRNTLVAVIALFSIYLVFEFATLWFRTFPKGFYYAGYAHEGAAWLTVALAATTFVLSAIFREATMLDPRIERLKRLAWGWSALNLLLALAVYNRMFIYVDFNGMTRMRTIGFAGITAVVVGFLLVVWKIRRNHDFAWLIERQLWTLALAIFVLAVMPVDLLVHTYNVRRILGGDLAPSVQITSHPVDSSGVLVLTRLTNADDTIIRDGIRALLADRAVRLESALAKRDASRWTDFQLADRLLYDHLRRDRSAWQQFAEPERRAEAWSRFRDYAYQWY